MLGAVPLHRPVRRLHHRQLDHAAEAQPRRRRAGARQGRAGSSALTALLVIDEGAAAHLRQGHAGGQGAGVRRRRRAGAGDRRDGRHGARHDGPTERMRSAARPAPDRDRSGRLAGARGRAAVPPGPSRHRPAGRLAADKGVDLEALTLAEMQAVEPQDRAASSRPDGRASVDARKSLGGTARRAASCARRGSSETAWGEWRWPSAQRCAPLGP